MKKILVLVFVALATYSSTFALDLNEYKVFYKLNNEKTFNSLVRYLQINEEQENQLKYVFELTEKKMIVAFDKDNEEAAEKAMWFNLANAKFVLTTEQYKNYLTIINMSVNTNNEVYFAEN